jgi:hypothetical protein
MFPTSALNFQAPGPYTFTGSSSVSLPGLQMPQGNSARTVMFVMMTSIFSPGYIFASGTSEYNQAFNIRCVDGCVGFMGFNNDLYPATCTYNVVDGREHFVAVTYGSNDLRIYVNGVLMHYAYKNLNTVGQNNYLGQSGHAGHEHYYTGSLRGVEVYSRVLSADEVNAAYLQTTASGEEELMLVNGALGSFCTSWQLTD